MKRTRTGEYETTAVGGERVRAYVPAPLPPIPPIDLTGPLAASLERALLACGRLDGISSVLPQTELFLYSYVRREAVLSSQIEGTQSSLSDLLRFEVDDAPGLPIEDVVEVSNYVAALERGMALLASGLPTSTRLLRETHRHLLARGRGADKAPGEFRRTQNWIGGSRPANAHFVPPPPHRVADAMGALERFIHSEEDGLPTLVRVAVVHVQFETIHPFLDGNGRVGRLLIVLMLQEAGVLRSPLLYLSLYFKRRREEYYRLLDVVRQEGEWEAWIGFFLDGVEETAENAVTMVRRLLDLFARDATRVESVSHATVNARRVFDAFQGRPLATIPDLVERLGIAYPTASRAIRTLEQVGIIVEVTGRRRERIFAYRDYLAILNEGTEVVQR